MVDEIKVGDNDTLSALVASLIEADLLIILSDVDGLYTDNPNTNPDAERLGIVSQIDQSIHDMSGGAGSSLGTGGMATKITAAEIATAAGVNMVIADGSDPDILYKVVSGDDVGTLFLGQKEKMKARQHWISLAVVLKVQSVSIRVRWMPCLTKKVSCRQAWSKFQESF